METQTLPGTVTVALEADQVDLITTWAHAVMADVARLAPNEDPEDVSRNVAEIRAVLSRLHPGFAA